MTYDEMNEMTNKDLVPVYNALAAQCSVKELTGWKQAKAKLIERIEGLQAQIADAEIDAEDEVDEVYEVPVSKSEGITASEVSGITIHEEVAEENKSKRTIKTASVALLCHVAFYEDRDEKSSDENRVGEDHPRARSVGLAYDEIIRRVQDEFGGCNTSVACLRWYSVKIRVEEHGYEGLRLPQRRPRAKPRTAS